jgi:FkbM family methyltransferase
MSGLSFLVRRIARQVLPAALVKRLQRSGFYLRRHYCERLAAFDPKDEPDLRVARALVQPGDVAVDVGANIGVYTRFLSRDVGSTGRVWSLEPVPFTYSVLAHNVNALGLHNVLPLRCAATESDQVVHLDVPRADSGHLDIYIARINTDAGSGSKGTTRVTAPGRSLDSLQKELGGRPAFLKIDVEGHESACLRGATRLLAECRPALLIEVTSDPDQAGSDAGRMLMDLAALDYACFWWDGQTLRRRQLGDTHVNHFFLQRHHVERCRAASLPVKE